MRGILPSDMKRLRRDNPQRALFENVEGVAGLAQVKIKADISSPSQDVRAFSAAEKCRLRAISYTCQPIKFIIGLFW